jgi:hypothetical protein
MPPSQRKQAGDFTGRTAEKLADQKQSELAERAGSISTINPIPEAILNGSDAGASEVDFTGPIKVKSATVRFKVNTDLEDVTIGQGNIFTFKRGVTYTASKHVYDHLEEKGLVYH